MIGTVRVTRVRFREDEVFEGSIPRECYENAHEEDFEVDDLDEAVRVFEREGVTFAATGNDWAASPDGSRIVDYGEGVREETTARLRDFSESDTRAIIERVG